jgi:hypothetical protein
MSFALCLRGMCGACSTNQICHPQFEQQPRRSSSVDAAQEEEEGLQGVFKRLRRNGHQLEK